MLLEDEKAGPSEISRDLCVVVNRYIAQDVDPVMLIEGLLRFTAIVLSNIEVEETSPKPLDEFMRLLPRYHATVVWPPGPGDTVQ